MEISDGTPDVVVRFDPEGKHQDCVCTIQAAVDQIISRAKNNASVKDRYIIAVEPGFFDGPVIIPKDAPTLEIRGAGAADTVIAAGIDACMPGLEYQTRFNDIIHGSGPKARAAFAAISARQKISTGNSAVVRICSNDVQLSGLTIRNNYACDRESAAPASAEPDAEGRYAQGHHQAVALMLDGADKVVVRHCVLSSFQDTLYLKSAGDIAARSAFFNCVIEGDVDFIFGGAIGFFELCTIRTLRRRTATGWALAPSTSLFQPFGLVFHDCHFQNEEGQSPDQAFLGRQWFEGVRATPYGLPNIADYTCTLSNRNRLTGTTGHITRSTLESVGKCHLQNCRFDKHLASDHLWDGWASGNWSPRYRPVQTCVEDFLAYLDTWLPLSLRSQYEAAASQPFLSQFGGTFTG